MAFGYRGASGAMDLDPRDLPELTLPFVYLHLNLGVRGVDIEIRDALIFHVRPDGYFGIPLVLAGAGGVE